MPLSRPSFATLLARVKGDILGEFAGALASLRLSVERAYAYAIAGASHLLHGRVDWATRQFFLTRESDEASVNQHASLFLGGREDAKLASGSITVTGTNGAEIDAGSVFKRSDEVEYSTNALATISGGTATIACTALVAGEAGNCDEDTAVTAKTPIVGVDSDALVAADGMTGGADEWTKDETVDRVLSHIQDPPGAGTESDFVRWALAAHSSVARAWCVGNYPTNNDVAVLVLDADDDEPSGLADVQTYLTLRRPLGSNPTAQAPTVTSTAITITDLSPDTTAIRDAVEAELDDLFTTSTRPNGETTREEIIGAIQRAAGVVSFTLTIPAAAVTTGPLEVRKRGTVTYA